MRKYQILEHKADLKIKIFGKTRKELFKNAMLAMFKGAKYEPERNGELKRKIIIQSFDFPSLLIDFLNEILYLVETKKEVYQKINFKRFSEKEIEAELIGKKLKRIGVQIKGVTYHKLDLHQEKDGTWQATVLFDI